MRFFIRSMRILLLSSSNSNPDFSRFFLKIERCSSLISCIISTIPKSTTVYCRPSFFNSSVTIILHRWLTMYLIYSFKSVNNATYLACYVIRSAQANSIFADKDHLFENSPFSFARFVFQMRFSGFYRRFPKCVNSANNFNLKKMSEKNIILNDWSNRNRVMTPLRKESVNPIIRIFNRQFELISRFFNKLATP